MGEMPMPFRPEMAVALFDGRKRQTRRIIRQQPPAGSRVARTTRDVDGPRGRSVDFGLLVETSGRFTRSPIQVGWRIWVREAWATLEEFDALTGKQLASRCQVPVFYPAHRCHRYWPESGKIGRYRAGRFMPRWASRITLTVAEVWAEQIQDISEADARAEAPPADDAEQVFDNWGQVCFQRLWGEIHGPEAWARNEWVWVHKFTVDGRNIGNG